MTQAIKQTCGLHWGCNNDWRDNGESKWLELLQESGIWSALCSHTADLPTLLKTSPDTHPYDDEFLPIQRELAQETQTGSFTYFLKWKQKDKLVLSLFPGSPNQAVIAISRQPSSQVILSLTVLAKGPHGSLYQQWLRELARKLPCAQIAARQQS